jgi:hypothetical protein
MAKERKNKKKEKTRQVGGDEKKLKKREHLRENSLVDRLPPPPSPRAM